MSFPVEEITVRTFDADAAERRERNLARIARFDAIVRAVLWAGVGYLVGMADTLLTVMGA